MISIYAYLALTVFTFLMSMLSGAIGGVADMFACLSSSLVLAVSISGIVGAYIFTAREPNQYQEIAPSNSRFLTRLFLTLSLICIPIIFVGVFIGIAFPLFFILIALLYFIQIFCTVAFVCSLFFYAAYLANRITKPGLAKFAKWLGWGAGGMAVLSVLVVAGMIIFSIFSVRAAMAPAPVAAPTSQVTAQTSTSQAPTISTGGNTQTQIASPIANATLIDTYEDEYEQDDGTVLVYVTNTYDNDYIEDYEITKDATGTIINQTQPTYRQNTTPFQSYLSWLSLIGFGACFVAVLGLLISVLGLICLTKLYTEIKRLWSRSTQFHSSSTSHTTVIS
ncbi:hypothetical protein [Poriferisphaera sp. WC338]|uniref:hypothetical protein n=1 Tax=Poriferisphaera sp. WC338 TaxID=3425129 RepID=UPI003D81A706